MACEGALICRFQRTLFSFMVEVKSYDESKRGWWMVDGGWRIVDRW
jgi:hypothetical protein